MNDSTLSDGRLPPDPTPAEEDASIKEEAIDGLTELFDAISDEGHDLVLPAAIAIAPGWNVPDYDVARKMAELRWWDPEMGPEELGEGYTGADLSILVEVLTDPAKRARVATAAVRAARWEITQLMRQRTKNDEWPFPWRAEVARTEIN